MTFKSLLTILACSLICLEAVSRAFAAGPAASHTTITNRIDIMGAVESAQENNAGGYGGQNIYSRSGEAGEVISSASKISGVDHQLASPDIIRSSSKTPPLDSHESRSVSETPVDVTAADDSGLSYSSYITTSSGPTISITSNGPNAHTISYSAPGGVFLSHGYPGSSYVLAAHHLQPRPPATYSSSSNSRGNYANSDYASSAPPRIEIPEASPSSSLPSSGRRNGPATVSGIPEGGYVLHSDPNSKIVISGGADFPSMINLYAGAGPAAATSGIYGYIGHPAYAAAYRNLEAARHIVDEISSAVTRAVNINFARFGAAR